jgi:antitoxin (DNA-binding transcriptional repressor) of toxin-antitoxin stability system
MVVGTKELKNRLSHYLRRVRAGEVVRVSDRDVVIAEIRRAPRSEKSERALLRELEADGAITLGTGKVPDFEPVKLRGKPLSREILEERR